MASGRIELNGFSFRGMNMVWLIKRSYGTRVMFAALAITVGGLGPAPQALAKKVRHLQPGHYLVPPPPPYAPSILPELKYGGQAPGPSHPYKKYVYSANGYEDPVPVKTHKTVTYWQPEASPVKTP
jgi:hypothetical protein